MNDQKAKDSIIRFLTHQASLSDWDELESWLKDARNEELYNYYIQTNFEIEHEMKKFNSSKLKSQLQKLMVEENKDIIN